MCLSAFWAITSDRVVVAKNLRFTFVEFFIINNFNYAEIFNNFGNLKVVDIFLGAS